MPDLDILQTIQGPYTVFELKLVENGVNLTIIVYQQL